MKLEPGLRITPSIQLRHLLGEGGMGEIWAADHLPLQRSVAVKFVTAPLTENDEVLRRFAAEAQTVARLQCDHVPQIFDYAVLEDGRPFIVMELLEGTNLATRLEGGDLLSLEETSRLLAQIAAALSKAHSLGIVHRDIKPENIFLGPRGGAGEFTAKLLDFGIAKSPRRRRDRQETAVGAILGTPWFMSPEQFQSARDVDARADLWSLGVVAYYCLTGALPFDGRTFGAIYDAIQRGEFREPSAIRTDLPAALDEWFRRSLSVDREERFASAAEMVAAFERAARARRDEGPIPAREVPEVPAPPAATLGLATLRIEAAPPPRPIEPEPQPARRQARRHGYLRPAIAGATLAVAAAAVAATQPQLASGAVAAAAQTALFSREATRWAASAVPPLARDARGTQFAAPDGGTTLTAVAESP